MLFSLNQCRSNFKVIRHNWFRLYKGTVNGPYLYFITLYVLQNKDRADIKQCLFVFIHMQTYIGPSAVPIPRTYNINTILSKQKEARKTLLHHLPFGEKNIYKPV